MLRDFSELQVCWEKKPIAAEEEGNKLGLGSILQLSKLEMTLKLVSVQFASSIIIQSSICRNS